MNIQKVNTVKAIPDLNLKKKNVCAYARVSTKKELQESSFELQVATYYKMITENPLWNFSGVFADYGKSGTSTNKRAEFNKMIQLAELGEIDMIITKSVSRFTRDIIDGLRIIQYLRARNIEVFFEKENISSLDSVFDMFLSIYTSVAEEESRGISSNVNWQYDKKVNSGSSTTSKLYGYNIVNGEFHINENEAPAVRLMFEMYLSNKTYNEIIDEVEKQGYKTSQGKSRFSPSGVRDILRNEKYCGDMMIRKTTVTKVGTRHSVPNTTKDKALVTNNHIGIVSKELFAQVKTMIDERNNLYNPNNTNKTELKYSNYVFSTIANKYYKSKTNHRNTKYEVKLLEIVDKNYNRLLDAKNIYYRQIDELLEIGYNTLKKNLKELKHLITNDLNIKTKAAQIDLRLESNTNQTLELKAKHAQITGLSLDDNLKTELQDEVIKKLQQLEINEANLRFEKIMKFDYSRNLPLLLRRLTTSNVDHKEIFNKVIAVNRENLILCIHLTNRNIDEIDLNVELANIPLFKGNFEYIQSRLLLNVNWRIIII